MSLIPFILELADELHEFNRCLATGGMDVDDFGFGIYPHELQPQHQQHQPQYPLPQQQQQHHHQRRPRSLSQFYWLSNLSKSRHHPYYRSKPCCNKTPIHFVHDHHLEKESTNAGSGGIGTSPTGGTSAGDKEPSANTHAASSASSNLSSTNTAAGKSAYSVVNKNGFQVSMNVKQFAPNELTVRTIDNCIVVEGQHEDKEDGHGVISRHFIRKYMLPKGYDPNEVLSTLSSDGILTVKAPPPPIKADESMERVVDIQQTGGPVQVQQSNVNINNSGKDEQLNTANAAAVTGTIPASVTVTLTQHQKQQSPQEFSAPVESIQKQQQQEHKQQPTMSSQPTTTKDLQITRERNGNLETNDLPLEQETESRTAEQKAASSNTNVANNINNNNNNNNSDTTSIEKSSLNDSTASKANSKMDVKETDRKEDEEKKVETDNVNTNNTPITTNAEATSSINNITGAANADEPMETEENEILKEDIGKKSTINDAVAMTEKIEDATMTNLNDINSNANSSTASINNNNTKNNIITTNTDTISMVETNGIEITTSNDVDIELTSTTLPETNDIVVVTNNGNAETKTTITADGLTISLETAVTEIDGVISMDAEVTDVADVADVVEGNGDGLVVDSIAIGVDIGESGIDVTATDGGGSSASVEDGVNDENISTNNLVVATESPSEADLVATADAAILLAKNKCDVDDTSAGDVTASKPTTIATEEITN